MALRALWRDPANTNRGPARAPGQPGAVAGRMVFSGEHTDDCK
jgi:hypothetical protein